LHLPISNPRFKFDITAFIPRIRNQVKNGSKIMGHSLCAMRCRICANNSLPAWRPAVLTLRFLLCKNLQLKNGMEAIFEQRKGLEGRVSPKGAVRVPCDGV
jgi:hypothetical protein